MRRNPYYRYRYNPPRWKRYLEMYSPLKKVRRNSDEDLRKLERLATSGDARALALYIHAYRRATGRDHPYVSTLADDVGIDHSGAIGAHENVNRDTESGIRYGIISAHELEDICDIVELEYSRACPHCDTIFEDDIPEVCPECEEDLEEEECYSEDPISRTINSEGVVGEVSSSDDVWIFRSPYYMRGTHSSPCAPGAVSINAPTTDGPMAYCPPHDWFPGGSAPHLIFRVEDNTIVYPDNSI